MSKKLTLKEELELVEKKKCGEELEKEVFQKGYKAILEVKEEDRTEDMNKYIDLLNESFNKIVEFVSLAHYLGVKEISFTLGLNTIIGLPIDIMKIGKDIRSANRDVFIKDLLNEFSESDINVLCEFGYRLQDTSYFDGDEDYIKCYTDYLHYLFTIKNIDELDELISYHKGETSFKKYCTFTDDIYNNLKATFIGLHANNHNKLSINNLNSCYWKLEQHYWYEKAFDMYNAFSLLIATNRLSKEGVSLSLNQTKTNYKMAQHSCCYSNDSFFTKVKKFFNPFKRVAYDYFIEFSKA